MTVQHQLELYIELIVNLCASSAKKAVHVIVSNLLCQTELALLETGYSS